MSRPGENMRAVMAANDFRIWRAAESVGWDCTMRDLADETGLHYQTIISSCKRRGWTERLSKGLHASFVGRIDVDFMMKRGSGAGR